jgi:hypothetical protein
MSNTRWIQDVVGRGRCTCWLISTKCNGEQILVDMVEFLGRGGHLPKTFPNPTHPIEKEEA